MKRSKCNRREYLYALRELTRETIRDLGTRKIPAHLRVAIKSHAQRLAHVRCELKTRRTRGR